MNFDGFHTTICSPAATFLDGSERSFVSDDEREHVLAQVRQALLPLLGAREFVVDVRGFASTTVEFRPAGTAAAAFLERTTPDAAVPMLHGIAFFFSGKTRADDETVIRGVASGRDGNGKPYPIPPKMYEKIRNNDVRPLLVLAVWHPSSVKDVSVLEVAHAIANVFFAALPD